jgi:phage terminase large subunit-like protein
VREIRGPERLPTETLEKRGSWLAPKRKAEERELPQRPPREVPPLQDEDDLDRIIRLIPGYDPFHKADAYEFDQKQAASAIDFIQRYLSHVKGEKAGTAFVLEDWERAIVANLFGWKDKKTGFRRYREAFIEVARKNGKTPLAAAIILYMLFRDNEPGAEIYGAASEYKQASLVFSHAWGMRNQEPELRANSKVFKGQSKSIEIGEPGDPNYGIYRVISSDSFAAHGFNTHGAVVDELHTQPNSELVDALLTSIGARRQPLIVYITTSDFEREGSVCNEKEDYAIRVRDGVIDDLSFLPVIYKASLDDDWTSEDIWEKANPNLGVSVSLDYLRRECKRAQESPTYENTFKRLHLNIRTQQDVRWLPMEKWDACDGAVPDLEGVRGFGGLDLSTTTDITAFVLTIPKDGKVFVVPFFWVPKENARKREERDKVPYLTWARAGLIRLTEGDVVDYDVVRRDINEIGKEYNFKEIAYDRWNAAQIATQLGGDGFEMVPTGQGFASMSAPAKELEKIVIEGGLQHGGHPVLRWMASVVAVEMDAAGNIKPSKKKSNERIDGIAALVNALSRQIAQPEQKPSVYEQRGALVF